MITMFAVKMVDLNDILQLCGRPLVCDYILNNVKHRKDNMLTKMRSDEVLEVDTSARGNFPVHNMVKAYRFLFIPVDLIEERLLLDSVKSNLEELKPNFMTIERSERIDKIINSMERNYEKFRDKCAGDNIVNSSCFMFIYDNNKLENVYITLPRAIINNIFLGSQEYKCKDCGKTVIARNNSFDNFMPDFYYEVKNNELNYYCDKCKVNHSMIKHIGE